MAKVIINDACLTDIADAIRTKLDTEDTYKPSEMADAIDSITGTVNNQNKTVHPSSSQQSIEADSGYTGLGTVTVKGVTVENLSASNVVSGVTVKIGDEDDDDSIASVTGIASGGITPTGTKQISITQNGTTTEDVTNYASAEIMVNVSGGGTDTFAGICNGTITNYESDALIRIPSNTLRVITTVTSIKAPNLQDIGSYGLGGYRGSVIVMPEFTGSIYSAGFAFSGATTLTTVDIGTKINRLYDGFFNGATNLNVLIIRKSSVPTLRNINAFTNTPFASGKAGGTLYVPNDLISTYQSATNWSTILGYETNSIQAIEGSIYENAYADGTPIT